MIDTATFGIVSAKIDTSYACQRYRRRTHRTGLKCYVEIRVHEPLLAKPPRSFLKHEQLRVRGWIVLGFDPVVSARQNIARGAVGQNRANRHLTQVRGQTRLLQSHIHRRSDDRGHGCRLPVTPGPVKRSGPALS